MVHRPLIPFQLQILKKSKKGIKDFYQLLSRASTKVFINSKWVDEMNPNIHNLEWNNVYKICFNTVQDNYLIWNQYKILNRILGVKKLLYDMKIFDNSTCRLCNQAEETILHLFL